jgi:hypothetical protein
MSNLLCAAVYNHILTSVNKIQKSGIWQKETLKNDAAGEVDPGGVCVLLLHLHSGPVLSPVLHPHPLGHGAGDGGRPPLVLRVHLPHPGGATVGRSEQVIFVSSSALIGCSP